MFTGVNVAKFKQNLKNISLKNSNIVNLNAIEG